MEDNTCSVAYGSSEGFNVQTHQVTRLFLQRILFLNAHLTEIQDAFPLQLKNLSHKYNTTIKPSKSTGKILGFTAQASRDVKKKTKDDGDTRRNSTTFAT